MTVRTVTEDSRELIEPGNKVGLFDIEILDGVVAWMLPDENSDHRAGVRVDPGETFRFESRQDEEFYLEAKSADVEYQKTFAGDILNPEETLALRQDVSTRVVTHNLTGGKILSVRPMALVTNVSPGADTNIQVSSSDLDLVPPSSGTLLIQIQVKASAVAKVEASVSGGDTVTGSLNNGTALDAAEWFTFSFPARSDVTYNFQVDTNVEVDWLSVDYTKEADL